MESCIPERGLRHHPEEREGGAALHPSGTLSRREFLLALGALLATGCRGGEAALPAVGASWRELLPDYLERARENVVEVNGRRGILASKLYPCLYIRDALFWGPLGLDDAELGWECWRWFADSQLESGQIRSAVALKPEQEGLCIPTDDEGALLFVAACGWLARRGYAPSVERAEKASRWIEGHLRDGLYLSAAGPFRYWADTVNPEVPEVIAHNQGLLCLARRAMTTLSPSSGREHEVREAQDGYRGFWDEKRGYLWLGRYSLFAEAQDVSAVFPEFISRYVFGESILPDDMVVRHVDRILGNAAVYVQGRLAGVKVISSPTGAFLPPGWYHEPTLNPRGDYQNGGYWPLYTLAALALAYSISSDRRYALAAAQLVTNELESDHRSKEVIRLTPGAVGTFDEGRCDYSWNALAARALWWSGLA